jgi:hypothetical protein
MEETMICWRGISIVRPSFLALVLLLFAPFPSAAGSDCAAEISATIQGREEVDGGVRLEFEVELTSQEQCADATFDLVLVEVLPNGQWKSVRLTRRAEIRGGTSVTTVEHVIASDLTLLEHEARVVECHPCNGP